MLKLLIIGAGPVGLTLAKELHYFGLQPRLIDQNLTPCKESRALALWSRTLEHLAIRQDVEPFLTQGLPMQGVKTYTDGRELFSTDLSHLDTPYPFALIVPQSQTETILNQQWQAQGGIVERGVSLRSYYQTADGVVATLFHHDSQREETVQVDYLFGCDGARSTVRHGLTTAFNGATEDETWVLGDVTLAGDPVHRHHLTVCWHANGPLALFPLPNGEVRLVTSRGRLDDHPVSVDELQTYLDQRSGFSWRITSHSWLSAFKINERIVDDYVTQRVVLLGDAAHIHSPAGGQGMNTGMQDAFNLAWKIALIAQGANSQTLLNSYATERRQIGQQVVARAAKMTHWVTLKNPWLIRLRNALLPRLVRISALQNAMTKTLAELNIYYAHSPLIINAKNQPGYPGTRLLDCILTDHTTLFASVTHPGHTLLMFGGDSADAAALLSHVPERLKIKTLHLPQTTWQRYHVQQPTWILVRPDQYIAARGPLNASAALHRYVANLGHVINSLG